MRPSSWSRTKVSRTAAERPSSIVKRSRDQSPDVPSRRIWFVIVEPDSCFHAQTRSANCSRPRSRRDSPCAFSCCSTTICVAMPAWSVPSCQSVLSPRIRWYRISTSISVIWNACPMCSVPVTFGGGSWMQNAGAPGAWLGLKSPRASQSGYHFASMAWGSKLLASSMTPRAARGRGLQKLEIIAESAGASARPRSGRRQRRPGAAPGRAFPAPVRRE